MDDDASSSAAPLAPSTSAYGGSGSDTTSEFSCIFKKSYQLFFSLNVSGKACVCVWLGRYVHERNSQSKLPRRACIGVRREREIDGVPPSAAAG